MSHRVAVVGGGIGGCAAALRLADEGHDVTLFEGSPNLGGLVVSFQVGGTPLECFYHHVFAHETDIIELIRRLGLELDWLEASMGVLRNGRLWPFTSPFDLLRFSPLPLVDRVRMGVGALRMGRVKDWRRLDRVPALTWLEQHTGPRATQVIWEPLVRGKFGEAALTVPAAFMYGRFSQRSNARGRGSRERFGYLRGGFRRLFDALEKELGGLGVTIILGTPVTGIATQNRRVVGIRTADATLDVDGVVFAGMLPRLGPLLADDVRDPGWDSVGALGALVVVLELDRRVTPTYWTNVCDETAPFAAIIEHTNLVPPGDYDGRHVMYLGRYFTLGEPIAVDDPEATATSWIEAFRARVPGAADATILERHVFRTPYAAPLVQIGHLTRLPSVTTDVSGLTLATTAQIYPQDRGMSEGVALGRRAAEALIDQLDDR